jgi:ABC-type transport system substrate-binding protein
MKGRQSGRLLVALLVVTALAVAGSAAWLGSQRASASSGASSEASAGGSGILRIGTTSYIDSFNPWNYIEGQGLNAMIMVYPLLVQVDTRRRRATSSSATGRSPGRPRRTARPGRSSSGRTGSGPTVAR